MDPQIQSVLTSVALSLATAVATWASTLGIVPSADKDSFANILVSVFLWLVTAAIGWYKTRALSQKAMIQALPQTAMIQAINAADNGVKVVLQSAPAPAVNGPITPTAK